MGSCGSADGAVFGKRGVSSLATLPFAAENASKALKYLCETIEMLLDSDVTLRLNGCVLVGALVGFLGLLLLLWTSFRNRKRVLILDFAVHKPHDR